MDSGIHIRPPLDARAVGARTLDRLATHAKVIDGVWARAVQVGDWIVVYTRNSTYSLNATGDGTFRVAGGWFSSHEAESHAVGVAGCTWGGHALHTGLVAAPGMCIEFSNGVRTTRIRRVKVVRGGATEPH